MEIEDPILQVRVGGGGMYLHWIILFMCLQEVEEEEEVVEEVAQVEEEEEVVEEVAQVEEHHGR